MLINITQDDYSKKLTQEAGVRIAIGDQGKNSEPYQRGFSLAPGFSYYIALKKVSKMYRNTHIIA